MNQSIGHRRWDKFRNNKRAWWSLWIFGFILATSCCCNLICNNRPLIIFYKDKLFFPMINYYPETDFGGQMDIEIDYCGPEFAESLTKARGWAIWPLVRYNSSTINYELTSPAPSPPSLENFLGTDDQGRDVLSRLLYGLRISLLFGLSLALFSSIIGIAAGAIQGYFGGWVDLVFQRIVEIWSGLPTLFLMMILASIVQPTVLWLLGIMIFFSWTSLVGVVRAEFLRARQYTYVRAAQVLGAKPKRIVFFHILPNAMIAALSYFPFLVSQSISALTALDFLGVGLPPGSPSLGELLQQAKANIYAPWLGITAFFGISLILVLVTFIGEGLRDAFASHGQS